MTPTKEYSKYLVTIPKEKKIQTLPDQEFKVIVFKDAQRAVRTPISNVMTSGRQYKNRIGSSTKEQNTNQTFVAEEYTE